MFEQILMPVHGGLLLLFGVALTAAFSGIQYSKRNLAIFAGFCAFSGGLQVILLLLLPEKALWQLYPLITHLPLILLLRFFYRKPTVAAMAATFTAYLCCQPAKWFGILIDTIFQNAVLEYIAQIAALLFVGYVAAFHLSACLSEIFNKDRRSVCIFGIVPAVYYVFDYTTAIYTDLWLRNDMRLLLSSLAISLENGDIKNARDMIASHIDRIEATRLERFCSIDTLNYVLSDYAAKCTAQGIPFSFDIALEKLDVDEILFCSILSNALDNALNAQKMLPSDKRNIRLMLKHSGGKLLLSVKNPVARQVTFINGLPVSDKAGHGYGTQSIRYLTERLGGNCQFSQQKDTFILRVVL